MRLVNAGSVGMPYEGSPDARWALLEDGHGRARRDRLRRGGRARAPRARRDSRCSSGGSSTRCAARSAPRRRRRRSRAGVARVATSREARRRGLGTRKERIRPIVERLAAEHEDATIALRFRTDVELLISVMLSAQTTDVNVNRVTETLFRKYRRPEDYLAVPAEELERDIYATGFYRQKTKSIRGAMRVLLEEFDGEVPRRLDDLLRLPGRRPEDRERRRRRARARAGDRRRHARPPSLAAARADAERRPGEDRARPPARRAARRLGAVPAPPDLARAPRL